MNIDTLSIARDLKAAELPAAQAEAIAAAIGKTLTDSAATRGDLDFLGNALRSDITQLQASLKADVAQLETRVDTRLEGLHVRLLTWFIGVQVAVGALIVALVKL